MSYNLYLQHDVLCRLLKSVGEVVGNGKGRSYCNIYWTSKKLGIYMVKEDHWLVTQAGLGLSLLTVQVDTPVLRYVYIGYIGICMCNTWLNQDSFTLLVHALPCCAYTREI